MKKIYNELIIPEEINFSIVELKAGEKLEISGNKIITIISGKIQDRVKGFLEKFNSSVYHSGKIEAVEDSVLSVFDIKDLDVILNKIDVDEKFGDFCRKNWYQLRELWDVEGFEKVDLYRSRQIDLEINKIKYKLNLWFCGKNVDCLFHNEHNFIEIHTEIAGDGFMQKAKTANNDGKDELIETVGLMPGSSHKTFNIKGEYEENGNPRYPIHRYLGGDKGNIWLVIEEY